MTSTTDSSFVVPDGFTLHTENGAKILLASNEAFLNPVQEFNRDLSVACIRTWSEESNKVKEAKWRIAQEKKAKKIAGQHVSKKPKLDSASECASVNLSNTADSQTETTSETKQYIPSKFVILEALAATGLRSIRYAREVPLVKYVIANDLSTLAIEAIRRNIAANGLAPAGDGEGNVQSENGIIRVSEGDACSVLYSHREHQKRVDVVDLDPYGTASPFIDAAVQAVNDGGLLCVTCTDLAVLGTTNHPEKCFSNYGGVSVKAEYCHEAALRLVLQAISTSASRYGRYIEPLLSLSIDFYVRLFIRVRTSPIEVKKAFTKTSHFYVCSSCQAPYEQPLGKMKEQRHEASGNLNYQFKTQTGPLVPERCPQCDSALHLSGPMWSGPIHNTEFVSQVLDHVNANPESYGTFVRMKGMLTVAKEELSTQFYFTPSKVASFFHCTTPPLDEIASALLNAGHKISRSHACPGSLKTTATREDIYDVFRSWTKEHPVRMDKLSEHSPARKLLAKELKLQADFTKHPDTVTPSSEVKLVRYQETPAHWGPGTRAKSGVNTGKRKREDEDV